MIELLLKANHERNQGFEIEPEYISNCYEEYICNGSLENLADEEKYYAEKEKRC